MRLKGKTQSTDSANQSLAAISSKPASKKQETAAAASDKDHLREAAAKKPISDKENVAPASHNVRKRSRKDSARGSESSPKDLRKREQGKIEKA